ncbi:KilA-N domain-containing protein [Tangfeifania diversioriginum]|uniref:KilA-N domain-containing protein n=1 Tax=Tangfeifania diversioriginum TaxID=1168035 RepID=UPI000932C1E2
MHNFLRGKELLAYINALHESKLIPQIRGIRESPLIHIIKGNVEDTGTWMQKNIALRFAQWLNPKFSVWCNQRIDEILTQGYSA